ncbi:MAG: HAD family phosphatase [Sphingomonadales bacterium]|nr:HAD family phosphatase [Sphingomonadales bacterium]MDE2567776.1 HAD family phosphatase [Sphingomonadales bacterium]
MSDAPVPAPVQAVVFDVGRVLVQWDMRALFSKLVDDPKELDWVMANVITEQWHFEHDRGRDIDEMVAERSAEFPDHAHLVRAWAERFNETVPGPVPGSFELVEQLSTRGVPLYAITNFGDALWARFRPTQPVFEHFRDVVVSGEEKLAKPDPALFALAARRFGFEPAVMLFIDDNAANVESAARCGWQVHHFDGGADKLRADLMARGLV